MKVAIAGGGVIGLAIAWRAAAGGHEVVLVDPYPGRAASWAAGGMLAPVAEAYQGEETITALGVAAAARWQSWAAEVRDAAGADPGYTRHGTLVVARDQDELAALLALLDVQQRQGLRAERVSSREARHLEPALSPAVRGGLWLEDDHQVDNRMYVRALIDACGRAGVSFVHERVDVCRDRAIELTSGLVVSADAVVVATGAWQPRIDVDGDPVTLPIRPVKGQIVRLQATASAVFPAKTVRAENVYVIPRDHGEIAIGATSEEKGYDATVTAGAVRELLTSAWELLPALAEAQLVEAMAGLRPGTPDNAPLIGPVACGAPTVIVAMGHYRHGVLFSPVTAEAVVAMIEGAPPAPVVDPFTPDRFTAVRA
ncbi:MAG: glycine oxidase ThiO [Actinobacteria bacterium]|nr:glycine oxidase ThiO [Actinomycetota bacterium]